jgi:hypothetical protein
MRRRCFLFLWIAVRASCSISQAPGTPTASIDSPAYQPGAIADASNKEVSPPVEISFPHPEVFTGEKVKPPFAVCGMSLIVDTEGMPRDVEKVRCSDLAFAKACTTAAEKSRFKPARTQDGSAVPYRIRYTETMNTTGINVDSSRQPGFLFDHAFRTPPGTVSIDAGPDGVYPLSARVNAPEFTKFVNKGFVEVSVQYPGHTACDVLLTINDRGKPSDPKIIHCDVSPLEKQIIDSLMNSQFKPASLNGKKVPVRAAVHIEFAGFADHGN